MKRILVIEDDSDIAEIVQMALTEKYKVKVETDNTQITRALKTFNPHVIMVDNQLGQKQASEIVQEIKQHSEHKNTPFVLFSGHDDIARIAQRLDATAYLSKPFGLADLFSCIEGVLSQCA